MCLAWMPQEKTGELGSLEDLVEWVAGGGVLLLYENLDVLRVERQVALFVLPNWLFFF